MKYYSRRELYALGETLGESVTTNKVGGGRIYGGGGGGGGQQGPMQTNVQNSNIPEYARPYVETMLGSAQQQIYNYDAQGNATGFRPYVPYGATVDYAGNITNSAQEQANAAVAGFSPLQQQAQYNVSQMRVPGQFDTGTGFAALGGIGAANIANQAAGAGQQYNQMATNPFAQQAFMSPYIQNALQPQLQEMQRQYAITGAQEQGRATGAGAFGGTRQALMQAENQRNKNMAMNQAIGTGFQDAFKSAQQAQQFGANLGLQGYTTALQGTGQLGQTGRSIADIGQQQLAAQQGIIGLQSQFGAQQQQLEQQKVNQAIQNYAMQQQYPMQQLAAMSGLLRGLPLQSTTTQSYQAPPSAISQIGGLGLAGASAYGLMKKEGGIIKSYAEGGSVEDDGIARFDVGGISRDVMLNPEKYSAQMIDRSTKNGVIDDIVGLAALQEKNQETKERQALMAMAQGTPPTVKDQILAEAQQLQGIDNAPSNLPTEYAGGGIVAFQEGGSTMSGFETESDSGALALDEIRRKEAEKRSYASMLGYTPKAEAAPAAAPAAKPDTGIRILPDEPKAAPSMMNAPAAAAEPTKATGTGAGGIDDLIRQITGDIRTSQEASKDARKEAKLMAMLQAGLGIASGTSQYAAANVKGALPALQGYQEEMRGIRGDEAKQIAQIAALNLKGAELKQELDKLGITRERYESQNKVDAARAKYLLGGGARGAGQGIANYGPVTNETYLKLKGQYDNFMVNPKSDPTLFAALPKRVKDALKANVGTPSHDRGLAEVRDFANQRFAADINAMRTLSARKGPSASAPYNPALE